MGTESHLDHARHGQLTLAGPLIDADCYFASPPSSTDKGYFALNRLGRRSLPSPKLCHQDCLRSFLLAIALTSLSVRAIPQTDASSGKTVPAVLAKPQPTRSAPPSTLLPAPKSFDLAARNAAVLDHLNAVVRIFRLAVAPIQKVGEPSDLLYRDQALAQSTQIAALAFQSSREEAALLSSFEKQQEVTEAVPVEGEAQKLQAGRANIAQHLDDLKTQAQQIQQSLEIAKPTQRGALQQQQEEVQGGIQLYQAMNDAMRKIASTSDAELNGGLAGDIARLQLSIPELGSSDGKGNAIVPAQLQSVSAARSSGVSTQAVILFQLLATRHSIDSWISESDKLHEQATGLRKPLLQLVRYVIADGQALSQQMESDATSSAAAAASKQTLPVGSVQAVRKRNDVIISTFSALSSALVPLTQEIITIEQSRTNLLAWRAVVDAEYREVLRDLLLKVLTIAIGLGILSILSSLWQRATTRYVRDIRRRRQLLVTRRVIIGFLSGLVVIFGFVTQFNSLATFAGFITAGIAVGLQTILLSVAAYFFIVGRYGVRVGDRITVAGVTGDVIDVGLVRFYMMELAGSGTELQPTGRVAVFANSVLFQSGTPLYRQMPGAEYGWHELSVKLALSANYSHASDELMKIVETVYESYKPRIEGQHRQVEAWMDSPIPAPGTDSRLQLVDGGLQLYIRYPVELRQGSQIDQQITQSVITLMAEDPELKGAVVTPPTIRALVKG